MSWQQMISIVQEARALQAEEEVAKPTACPNDGTPLKETPDGVLFCPFDGWTP
jgi:hypothetical protein